MFCRHWAELAKGPLRVAVQRHASIFRQQLTCETHPQWVAVKVLFAYICRLGTISPGLSLSI